jgi:hypothetical protein
MVGVAGIVSDFFGSICCGTLWNLIVEVVVVEGGLISP